MVTIIFAHPWEGSFNRSILDSVISSLQKSGQDYNLIDLYKDHFNPVYSSAELALFSKGESLDPLVKKYQKTLKQTDSLIFIFPIWWYDIPSILKGFLEKVFLKEVTYKTGKMGLIGLLDNVKNATVITTSDSPTWYLSHFKGNIVRGGFINATLKGVGVKKTNWINCDRVGKISNENRQSFLNKIEEKISALF